MTTFPNFTFGDSPSFHIEKSLSKSEKYSLTHSVATSTVPLVSGEASSNVDFIKDAANNRYDIDDTSSSSMASVEVPDKSKVLLHHESSQDSCHSFRFQTSSTLTDDSYDSDLEEACTFNDPDDLLDYLSPRNGTAVNPSALQYRPYVDSTSSTPIFANRHNASFTGLHYLLSDTAPFQNPLIKDLQAALSDECMKHFLPQTLIDMCTADYTMDIDTRQPAMERKCGRLESSYLRKSNQISGSSQYDFKTNETEPANFLHASDNSNNYSYSIKSRLDLYVHEMMKPVQKDGNLLDETAKGKITKRYAPYIPRKRPMLSRRAVRMMEEWYATNYEHPYPNVFVVEDLAKTGGITNEQVKKWFANKRNRCKNTPRVPDTDTSFQENSKHIHEMNS
ncbi:hypothetical protein ACJMK2_018934 [Sinanodonta woodiana]|uniref:Homeobox domain-containing protein n=1 Tax=Sinanodonta woodiana TaxID=1069815 RepID=A0ABD3UGI5_SINWO